MQNKKDINTNQVTCPAIVTKITTLPDRSLRLYIETQELTPETKALIFSLHEQYGQFCFSLTPIDMNDLPEEIILPNGQPFEKALRVAICQRYRIEKKANPNIKKSLKQYTREFLTKILNEVKTL